jgi:hypothetical protein
MTDRPIIFSGPMVRALLEGRKTQTRRLATSPLRRCEVGDRLWVREAFRMPDAFDHKSPAAAAKMVDPEHGPNRFFEADSAVRSAGSYTGTPGKLRPSIHMPRWASRLTLVVEDVRPEQLQSISDTDARDEGVNRRSPKVRQMWLFGADQAEVERIYLRACPWEFRDLWNSLHAADGERWEDNPEIVALTFRVERGNIDRIAV